MGNPVPRFPSDEPSATPSGFTPRRVQRPARITRQDRYRVQRTYRGLRSARSARIAAQIARNSASIQPTTSDQSLMQQQPSCDEPETTSPSNRELTNPPSHQVDANGLPTLHGLPPRDYDVYSLEEALELGTRRLTFMGGNGPDDLNHLEDFLISLREGHLDEDLLARFGNVRYAQMLRE